jgi:hypothetical protein
MFEIQQLQAIALSRGFKKTGTSDDGNALWLRCTGPSENGIGVQMCIDAVTQSATVFWNQEDEQNSASKTFRTAQAMQAWLDSTAAR